MAEIYQILAGDTLIQFIMLSKDQGGILLQIKSVGNQKLDFQWTERSKETASEGIFWTNETIFILTKIIKNLIFLLWVFSHRLYC